LAEDEKTFGPVIAHQRFGNGLGTGFDASIAVKTWGSRSPLKIASRIAKPVVPVKSLMTVEGSSDRGLSA
jgi:hypothetical protein